MARAEFSLVQADDRFLIIGPGWSFRFDQVDGRWTHALAFGLSDQEETTIACTVESHPERDDPTRVVSPVYQEIHYHEVTGAQARGLCFLLTGRLFQHHFSAAVSLSRAPESPGLIVLDIDVADRCRSAVSSLAATYLVGLGSSDLVDAGPQGIVWAGGALGPGRLELRCDLPSVLALAEAGRRATRVQAVAAIDAANFTHRLRYRWRWESSSGLIR
jgi:hypothetical protein